MAIKVIQSELQLTGQGSYLACFDPYVQSVLGLTPTFVRRRFVLECLLSDRVFTSVSHVLGSWISFDILQEFRLLLDAEIILLYSREYNSIQGVVADRLARFPTEERLYQGWGLALTMSDYRDQLFNACPGPRGQDIEKIADAKLALLQQSLRSVVSHSPMAGMTTYKNELVRDLRALAGTMPRRRSRRFVGRLTAFIEDTVTDRLNRHLYAEIVRASPLSDAERRAVLNVNVTNYCVGYLSNLNWKPSTDAPFLVERLRRSPTSKPRPARSAAALGFAQSEALRTLIEGCALQADLLDSLNAEDIIELRTNVHLQRFREETRLVARAMLAVGADSDPASYINDVGKLVTELCGFIRKRLRRQCEKMRRFHEVRGVCYTLFLLAAGSFFHPLLLLAAGPPLWDYATNNGLSYRLLRNTHRFDLIFLARILRQYLAPGGEGEG